MLSNLRYSLMRILPLWSVGCNASRGLSYTSLHGMRLMPWHGHDEGNIFSHACYISTFLIRCSAIRQMQN
uniref:Uncharacterized protein n=1 Tax=Arundo donax TaxID=35708 RepID=A0A0A9GFV4_ARUDO